MAGEGPTSFPLDAVVSWEEFKRLNGGLVCRGIPMICRGQANEQWALRTSFHRWAQRTGMNLSHYLDVVIPEVYYEVLANIPFSLPPPGPQTDGHLLSLLALLQHHGFPTPLLDWTWSPYIAAYFAFREIQHDGHDSDHVRVFSLDVAEWTRSYSQPYELRSSYPFVSLVRPFTLANPRIVPQQAIFTVTNLDDMEPHLRQAEPREGYGLLYSFRLPLRERTAAMRELRSMGITEAALFPGLDGLCRGLADAFMKGDVGETSPERLRRFLSGSPFGAASALSAGAGLTPTPSPVQARGPQPPERGRDRSGVVSPQKATNAGSRNETRAKPKGAK